LFEDREGERFDTVCSENGAEKPEEDGSTFDWLEAKAPVSG
jgi:hypothetical protein